MPVDLAFIAADTLTMPLYQKTYGIYGADKKNFRIGNFKLSLWMEVQSSNISDKELGMFCVCSERVYLYLFITPKDTRLAIFDAEETGVNKTNWDSYGEPTIAGTLKKLGKSIKGWYYFSGANWGEMPKEDVVQLIAGGKNETT